MLPAHVFLGVQGGFTGQKPVLCGYCQDLMICPQNATASY
ncbi:unnamed protein product [Acidithrix sp. C25]|nr:unnamed protein product [Acidithrix sp. C25]